MTSVRVEEAESRAPRSLQGRELAFADHAIGDLGHDAQHAFGRPVVVGQRRVGEGVIGLFREAAALEIQKQRLVPGRLPGRQHMGNPGADIRPDLRPDLVRPAADDPVALEPDRRKIGVVAKKRELGTPGHPHRETRGEHHLDDRLQAERPVAPEDQAASPTNRIRASPPGPDRRRRRVAGRPPPANVWPQTSKRFSLLSSATAWAFWRLSIRPGGRRPKRERRSVIVRRDASVGVRRLDGDRGDCEEFRRRPPR